MRPFTAAVVLAILTALLAGSAGGQNSANEKSTPPKAKGKIETVAGYKKQKIDGFTVHIHEDVLKEDTREYKRTPVEALELELQNLTKAIPKKVADTLRAGVPVWVDWDVHERLSNGRPGSAAGSYMGIHPRPILINGKEPIYVSGVRIFRMNDVMRCYKNETDQPPDNLLLHEFVHAVHDLVFGMENPQIKEAYRQAMERKLYDKELYVATNDKEFFAELSCAYLAEVARYFPHTREELKRHDPVTFKMMESLWGKPKEGVAKKGDESKSPPESMFSLDVALDQFKWGEQIGGPPLKPEDDFHGRVVVIDFWVTFVPESLAGLTRLAQLHEELNDFGLVVVAAYGPGGSRLLYPGHLDPPQAEMKALARSRGVAYPLFTSAKSDQLNDTRTLPHCAVFDPSGKCIYRGGPFEAEPAIRAALGKTIVAGAGKEKFTANVAPLAHALEEGQPPATVLQKLIQVYRGASGTAADEAKALIGQMTALGQKRFDDAEKLLKSDPVGAFVILDRITTVFKNTQLASKASDQLNTLKIHKEVALELRAKPALDAVRKLESTLSGKPRSFDPLLPQFQRDNAGLLQQLRDAIEKVRKQAPGSKAAEEAAFVGEKYAIKMK
jgi:hypothetical protein